MIKPIYKVALALAMFVLGTHDSMDAHAQVLNPANDHFYELVVGYHSWTEAKAEAETRSFMGMRGHLATITSAQENDFISTNFQFSSIWLGGFQVGDPSDSSAGWQWVTGEQWNYTKWYPGEPNDFGRPENFLEMIGTGSGVLNGTWNDLFNDPVGRSQGYVVEYESGTSQEFTINITAFIPGNNMSASPRKCVGRLEPVIKRDLFVKTDDRWFDPNATTYRTRHLVTIIPDESVDPDGLKDGTVILPLTQATRLYASDALPVIDQNDDDGVLGDCSLLHAVEFPLVNNAQVTPTRIGPKKIRIRLQGDVGTGAAFGLGLIFNISWDVTLEIDTSGPSPRVAIQGQHDGFPAYEIYVNNQTIYTYSPGLPPYRLIDLRRLAPPMEINIPLREMTIQ